MSENDTERTFSFIEGTAHVIIDGVEREVTYNDEWQPVQPEGFTWRTVQYENTDKTIEDGAIVRVLRGGRIAVEMKAQSETTEKAHKFWEVHLSGKAKLLTQRPDQKPQILEFGYGKENFSPAVLIGQGTIFCIFADPNQKGNVFYYESEIPGYVEDALPHVEVDAIEFKGLPVSREFWQEFHKLDTGLRFNSDGTVRG